MEHYLKLKSLQRKMIKLINDIGLLRDIYRRASLTVEADQDLFAAHPEWLVWDDKMMPFTHVAVVDGRAAGFITDGIAHTEGGPAPRMYLDVTRTVH